MNYAAISFISAVGLKYTTSGSSFGACSSSATFCLLWLRLVFVVDSLGWWLPQRVRWRGAGPRDDVMSAVLVDRGSGHGGGSKGYFLFAMASPCCKSSKSMLILWQRNQTYLSEGVDKGSRIARGWKSHAIPWSIFLDSGEESFIVKNNLQELMNDTSFDV